MKLVKDMKVRIKSSNDLLKAYQKANMPFYINSVVSDGVEDYVTLRFEDGQKLEVVIMGYEVIPFV